ncbi:uncharacterized protein CTHT_0007440 [Thermochaetoides thermophila DSM 1495]|uniref:Early meiotic induction protein 1 n=1 Tax=Chaetomium thermophilum (strain DSM 1495 / CBS 144.50 / IMI 039719) TaxID=759272 RepID=G0RYP7_CHATD|nr:hypothetical protein CTHT_0007440 [Thermochaetoides thermophila DSM 1495]EGS24033.1 hypothetical protein CTHT_0007440 [Thermochaetoides thermophila DSM 1495]
MGWFWSSSSPKSEESNTKAPTSTPLPPSQSIQTTPQLSQPKRPETEEEAADREMALFIGMLMKEAKADEEAEAAAAANSKAASSSTSKLPSWIPFGRVKSAGETPGQTDTTGQQQKPKKTRPPHSYAMSEHLLPTTMSCRDAFDYAWHCHTPGSQLNAVYRYGTLRTCSELWDDFWFCMRVKSFSPQMREEAIKAHYRAKEEAKYGGGKPSSEDVWESREERVEPGTAFRGRFERKIENDKEFLRQDAERRRKIRDELGFNESDKGQ